MIVSAMVISLSACVTADDPNRRAKTGAAIGAAAGVILGHAIEDGTGDVLAGAAPGGGIGHYMDNQQREMKAALAEERARHDVEVQWLKDETLKIDIASEVSFDFDSASLKSSFTTTLEKVSNILTR